MNLFTLFGITLSMWRAELHAIRHDDRGMTTETVIITATLAALALAVLAVIWGKVTGKADTIPVDGPMGSPAP